jgi:hypothetical protein
MTLTRLERRVSAWWVGSTWRWAGLRCGAYWLRPRGRVHGADRGAMCWPTLQHAWRWRSTWRPLADGTLVFRRVRVGTALTSLSEQTEVARKSALTKLLSQLVQRRKLIRFTAVSFGRRTPREPHPAGIHHAVGQEAALVFNLPLLASSNSMVAPA